MPEPLVLVAHGSADPRAAVQTRALARAVGGSAAFLDHAGPRPGDVLRALAGAGHRSAVVVPLLLTAAYHGRIDLPAAVADAPLAVTVTDVLGPVGGAVAPELLDGLQAPLPPVDGVVLASAGTRDPAARRTVASAAAALGERLGVGCVPAFASGPGVRPGAAVRELRRDGRRVAMAAYFLAVGRLYDAAVVDARAAGAVAVAPPLGAAPGLALLARLVRRRAAEAARPPAARPPAARPPAAAMRGAA